MVLNRTTNVLVWIISFHIIQNISINIRGTLIDASCRYAYILQVNADVVPRNLSALQYMTCATYNLFHIVIQPKNIYCGKYYYVDLTYLTTRATNVKPQKPAQTNI